MEIDDTFLQSGFDFLADRENKTVTFTLSAKNGDGIQQLTSPNASLVSEQLTSSSDGAVRLTLNYVGHG